MKQVKIYDTTYDAIEKLIEKDGYEIDSAEIADKIDEIVFDYIECKGIWMDTKMSYPVKKSADVEKEEEFYTKEDIIRTLYDDSVKTNAGFIGILKPEVLKPEYRQKKYQLFRMTGGFGAENPHGLGNAVFGSFCADGEKTRMEKYDFIGVADEKTTKDAEELEKNI